MPTNEFKLANPHRLPEDEIRLRTEEVRKGTEAKALLTSSAFQSAFAGMREEVFERFWDAPMRDDEGVKKLKSMAWAAQNLIDRLTLAVETGRMAEQQLEQHETLRRD